MCRPVYAVLVFAAIFVISSARAAGTLAGRVYDDCGTGIYELQVWPTAGGTSTSYEHKTTDPSGYYTIAGLPAGTYCVGVSDTFHFRRHFYSQVTIRDDQTTVVDFPLHNTYTVHTHNDRWDGNWHFESGQAFVSTGGSIVMVTTRIASSHADHRVSIHSGGPGGAQIGPSRTLYAGSAGRGTVAWLNGEVSTVKGQTYYVKITRVDGSKFSCFIDDDNGGATYPYGQAYYDGSAQPSVDLQLFIETDDDGMVTMYRVKDGGGGGGSWNEVGQTFVARSANIMSAGATVGVGGPGTYALFTFSIHSGGPGGAQIGPSKTVRIWDCQTGLVQWQPGEVPVTSGQTYYLKIRRADGSPAYVFYHDSDQYPYGQLYTNGAPGPAGWDLRTTIMGEATDKASRCTITGRVTDGSGNGVSGAVVSANKCGYQATTGVDGSYSMVVTGDVYSLTCAKSGFVTLTANNYSAVRGATQTLNWQFPAPNVLTNPGFELGNAGDNPPQAWAKYGHGLYVRHGTGYGGITPHGGLRYATNEASWTDPKTGGIYQTVGATAGVPVTVSLWAACYGLGGGAAHTFSRVGIDPTGGTNPASALIVWSPWYNSPADGVWQWTQLRVTTVPSSLVTIFADYKQESTGGGWAYEWQVNAFDDVAMADAVPTALAEAKQEPDGRFVYFSPVVITAKFSGTPNYLYVEDPQRAQGIRVNGSTGYVIGDKVSVSGTIRTTLGERYVDLSSIQYLESGRYVDPLGMTGACIGGAANGAVPGVTGGIGTNNIGLLVTAWGRVTRIDAASFYLNDGSTATTKVLVASTSDMPVDGSYAVVTGASSTCDASGGTIGRLIRARLGEVRSY